MKPDRERAIEWILELKRVMREWDSIKYARLTQKKIEERNAKRKRRKPIFNRQQREKMRRRLASKIIKSL